MQNKLCFEVVDRTLRDVCTKDILFGGIPIVLGGDFAQIPPVVKNGNRTTIVDSSIQKSGIIWPEIQILHLHANMRLEGVSANDLQFKEWLYQTTYNPAMQNIDIEIPSYIDQWNSLDCFIAKVYPQQDLERAITHPELFAKTSILSTRNDTVDLLNQKVLDLIPGQPFTLLSSDTVAAFENDIHQVSSEYLQTITPSGFPPAKLTLKVGCIVMLLRNLNPGRGLCNGTRLIVKQIFHYALQVVVINDNQGADKQIQLIPRIRLSTNPEDFPFVITRKQFPVTLSFAMTINKAQGQSLKIAGIDLRYPPFTHGQLYVALSRATNIKGIHVLHHQNSSERTVKNIIYPELLLL